MMARFMPAKDLGNFRLTESMNKDIPHNFIEIELTQPNFLDKLQLYLNPKRIRAGITIIQLSGQHKAEAEYVTESVEKFVTGILEAEKISGHSILTHLGISNKSGITDAGFEHIAQLTNLQHLEISGCKNITDIGLAYVAQLTNLQHLQIHACENITDEGLAHIAKLTKLHYLVLTTCDQITDEGLEHIAQLTNLKYLFIAGNNITQVALNKLKEKLIQTKITP